MCTPVAYRQVQHMHVIFVFFSKLAGEAYINSVQKLQCILVSTNQWLVVQNGCACAYLKSKAKGVVGLSRIIDVLLSNKIRYSSTLWGKDKLNHNTT